MSSSRAESQHPQYTRRRSNTATSLFKGPVTPLKVGDKKTFTIWVHDPKDSPNVLFNHSLWPGIAEGDMLSVRSPGAEDSAGFFFVASKEEGNVKPQLQISIPRFMADTFGLRNNGEIVLTKVEKEKCSADHVEFIFQDQYLGRNDMWRLGKQLVDQCVYVEQEVSFIGAPAAKIQGIFIDGKKVSAAYVTSATKAIYRSLTARTTIFIQVCKELWEFAGDGERYTEKIIHSFLPALFNKWREAGTNHIVTIVLISRVYYDTSETEYAAGPLRRDDDGKWYKDFYKVITDLEVIYDWKPTLLILKDSFVAFQRDILLTHHYHRALVGFPSQSSEDPLDQVRLVGRLSCAHDGPILEAINLGLNPTETHYIDRSLSQTGAATILITPGTGYYRVSKQLLRLTTVRMLDQGFGLDLVSLAKPPLHQSPIFSFQSIEPEPRFEREGRLGSRIMDPLWDGDDEQEESPGRERTTFWWDPFWMSVSFWDKQMDLPFREDRFIARAKMYEIEMLGLLDHDVLSSIEVPYMPEQRTEAATPSSEIGPDNRLTKREADLFDQNVFSFHREPKPTTTGRNSLASSASGTIVAPSSLRSSIVSYRSSMVSQVTLSSPNKIHPIEESPLRATRDLPVEQPSESERPLSMISFRGLSSSPSQSSILSNRSTTSTSTMSSVNPDGRPRRPGSARSVLSARLSAPSWLFNPFRSGPSHPQTSPISASGISSTHNGTPTLTALDPTSTTPTAATPISRPPRPVTIRNPPTRRLQANRTLEEDGIGPQRKHTSPINTPPARDDTSFGARRSTALSLSMPPISSSPNFRTNPSRPRSSVAPSQATLARRWEHMFAHPLYKHDIKWKSMTTPGCLPLTTEYFPSGSDLEALYDVHEYGIYIDPTEIRSFLVKSPNMSGSPDQERRAWALMIMRVMAAVRLAQGFQFILQPKQVYGENDRNPLRRTQSFMTDEEMVPKFGGASQVLESPDDPVYISMSNEIHRISYNREGETVQIRRYVRRMPSLRPFQYQCLIWPKLGVGYTELKTSFISHGLENYLWNRLDMVVAGVEPQFNESLRYWRTRFVVIPTAESPSATIGPAGEKLNEEEIRLLGMDKLAELFTRLRWRPLEERTNPVIPVRFLPTDLGPTTCLFDEHLMAQLDEIHAKGPLKKKVKSDKDIANMSLANIARAMREDDGVPIKDRRWHTKRYTSVFTGAEFVSWLVREFRDVSTREQGVEVGQKLLDQGLFEHSRGMHGFLDGHYFYQLKGEFAVHTTPKTGGWFRSSRHVSNAEDNMPRSGYYPSSSAKASSPRKPKRQLILSQSMAIDIDPVKRSDQAECVVLHHDIIHNPATCFHFELHWMGTTARCIEDTLRQWSRTIERYGLKLVEAYVGQIADIRDRNAFQSCFPIRLAIPPPVVMDLEKRVPEGTQTSYYFEYALLKRFGFILDIEAAHLYPEQVDVNYSYRRAPFSYSQFIHRSGVAFVQVLPNGNGFLFLTNRLLAPGRMGALKSKEQRPAIAAEELRVKLHAFCDDGEQLMKFYDEELIQLRDAPEEPPPLNI
ncbi:hypothetical protein NEOLEDRAFT_1062935 [Neolentinus lepideus HHB14362 ss-1]|uniref:Vacuolar membrane-associated protein IML1 n=1 Tax=Neolentinus lepideus HHB14362 ss-1 TaxID=1314782 RepID=A0A165TFT1_9AGAM|nr:hypothetical protein NEOLEDRAFT_1062935 [Neolentinus lepideus HHB14362 ss-1]